MTRAPTRPLSRPLTANAGPRWRNSRYSVPVRLIGHRVRVLLHASDLVIYDGRTEAARHERLPSKSGPRLDLDHYGTTSGHHRHSSVPGALH